MHPILDAINFDARGLVPAIAQQHDTGEVLMLAWMDRAAVAETLATGRLCYFSRSRNGPWRKGETSGQVQRLVELRLDCDGDALLVLCDQTGVACHTGRRSCFYLAARDGALVETEAPRVDPAVLYPGVTLLYIVAGEASGDVLGARLMAALRRARPGLDFAGVGGERMAEQGLASLFPMRELSLMGLVEVLPKLRGLARRMAAATADILARRPALLVTIDAPSFTLRLAGRVRPSGIPVVHYVAPQVWAWRPGRVRTLAGKIDRLLALLPFEPPFFEAAGIPTRFVGHPVLESGVDRGDAGRFAAKHGLAPDDRPVLAMPGSRRGEVARLGAIFGEALAIAHAAEPRLRPVVPVLPQVAAAVREAAASWPGAPILVDGLAEKHDAFAAAQAGLIKSGTSSLELAVAGIPHVVGYRVNPITAAIVRRLVRVPHASLVNLLLDRAVVPELLQEACAPAGLAAALLAPLRDPRVAADQRAGFAAALAQLRPASFTPSEAAAAAVLETLEDALRRG